MGMDYYIEDAIEECKKKFSVSLAGIARRKW